MTKPPLTILLASPRGFCAGVDRAIQIVEAALERFGAPVYVRHEIVHNRHVVDSLAAKGAVFVDELDQIPDGAHVIFSAHGVAKAVTAEAGRRGLSSIDATCPLVKRVHSAVKRHNKNELQIILIGHAGHPEVVGTMGQLPDGKMILVETPEDVWKLQGVNEDGLAYTTQTTLSIEETKDIIQALKQRFPQIKGPEKGDL
jgi:4-hydroxy-3-methylbut-2-enyl diphosphate reductase